MDEQAILTILLHGNDLKQTARTGWVRCGVPNPENVATHSYGVTFTVLILSQWIQETIDLERALVMAVLHDLPEGLTTDIPVPAWRYLPAGIKLDVERGAMNEILGKASFKEVLMGYWEEMNAGDSVEAKLVHDADKLDMYIQAYVYERQTGNRQLQQFWDSSRPFHFPESQAIYNVLLANREN